MLTIVCGLDVNFKILPSQFANRMIIIIFKFENYPIRPKLFVLYVLSKSVMEVLNRYKQLNIVLRIYSKNLEELSAYVYFSWRKYI